jgi:5-hydroxyisourate hydrolase-like protein (transthyretin family)
VTKWPGLDDVTIRAGETTTATWGLEPVPPPKVGPRAARGRVTDSDTGAPLPNIRMSLEYFHEHWLHPRWEEVATAVTDADGNYAFAEPPEAMRLSANDVAGLYERVEIPYHDPEPGETLVADAAMTKYMSKYGRFAGRVTTNAGAPVQCGVYALRQDGEGSPVSGTNANGEYSFYALPGVYRLQFHSQGQVVGEFYDDAATIESAQPLTVTAGQTLTANASLAELGRFAGRVTDSAGKPIQGAWVRIYEPPWQSYIADVMTDDQGRYTSPYLQDGEYRVRFFADGYDDAVWGGGHDVQTGADVSVRVDKVVEGIDAVLGPLGVITGRVVDRLSGAPLAGIRVDVGWSVATTGNDGAFTLTGLRSREYKIVATDAGGKYPEQSVAVTVTAPLTTTVEFPLDFPGHVVGQVTDPNNAPLPGVEVTFLQGCCWSRTVKTDAEGRYDSGPLPGHHYYYEEFDYIIAFGGRGERYKVEYYDDAATKESAKPVTVAPGATVMADAALDTLGRITGRVTDKATGLPIANGKVSMSIGQYKTREVRTGEDGRYLLEGLPAGPNSLNFTDCCGRYASITRPVTLTLNTTLEGEDAALSPWGKVTGRVIDERTGAGILWAWVTAYRAEGPGWERVRATVTDADGRYTFGDLYSGAFRIEFTDPRGRYRAEAYSDAASLQAGADVIFTPGQDTPNIDAALAPTGEGLTGSRIFLPLLTR